MVSERSSWESGAVVDPYDRLRSAYRSHLLVPQRENSLISLVVDIGQGAGLAGATGVRPYLPPLLAGALASNDTGLDFDGTSWDFLEQPWFLLIVLALAVASYMAERSGANRSLLTRGLGGVGVVLGGLLFAGSLAEGGHSAILGLVIGAVCAAFAWLAVGGLLDRAARRLEDSQAAYLALYADAAALVLAAIAIFVPVVSFFALIAFAVLLVRARGTGDEKYAGPADPEVSGSSGKQPARPGARPSAKRRSCWL